MLVTVIIVFTHNISRCHMIKYAKILLIYRYSLSNRLNECILLFILATCVQASRRLNEHSSSAIPQVQCLCTAGWSGETCEHSTHPECQTWPCTNGGICVPGQTLIVY